MAYEKKIKITKDGQEATILENSWKVYERNGWTRADDGSSSEPASAPQPAAPAPATDPSKEG